MDSPVRRLIVALAVLLALVAVWRWGVVRLLEPSLRRYPVRGIDVSHHQGEIAWERIAAADHDIRFAFLKASEGREHRDPRFDENWRGAGSAGLARGAYHFFTFCRAGAEQAANYLDAVGGRPFELPPVADVEFAGNCESWDSIATIRLQLQIFLDLVEQELGVRPLLYLTRDSRRRIAAGAFGGYQRWARSTVLAPTRRTWGRWVFWQYRDDAEVDGIRGPVDMNVFHGDLEAFERLTSRVSASRRPRPETGESPTDPPPTAGTGTGSAE